MHATRTSRPALILLSSLWLWPLTAAADQPESEGLGIEPGGAGERIVEVSRAAVLPPIGEVDGDLEAEVLAALRGEAEARGWQVIDDGDARAAMASRQGVRLGSPDLIEVGRGLGAGAVVATEITAFGDEIEIKLRAISTHDDLSVVQFRVATRQTAAEEARLGLAAALPQAPAAAAIRVPPPPAPAPPPPPAPAPAPVQVVALPPGYVLVAPGVIAAPVPGALDREAPPRAPRPPLTEEQALRADMKRGVAIFGVTAGVQAGALYLTSMIVGLQYGFSFSDDHAKEWKATAIVYAALAPAISAVGGWGIGDKSRISTVSYPAILGGTYAGSAASLAIVLTTYESRGDHWVFSWVMAPILLPAIGAAVGWSIGHERRKGAVLAFAHGRVEWSLPAPAIVAATDGSRRLSPGVSLGTLTF